MNLFKPKKVASRGNPKQHTRSATFSLSLTHPRTVGASGTPIPLTSLDVATSIYNSFNQSFPSTAKDDFTYIINYIRVSSGQLSDQRLDFFDIETDFASSDYGTASSRANCGVNYGAAQRVSRSSLDAASAEILCLATITPAATEANPALGRINFETNVSVVCKNKADTEAVDIARDQSRVSVNLHKMKAMFAKAGLDPSALSENVRVVPLDDRPSRRRAPGA